MQDKSLNREWTLTGWHILYAMVGFFGVIITVNAVFLYYAVTSFSGIETSDAYRKGIAYNARLAEGRALDNLGWKGTFGVNADRIELVITDTSGAPVRGLALEGRIGRPSTDRFDRDIVFTDVGEGRYVANTSSLGPGNWIVAAESQAPTTKTSANADIRFRLKDRLWISQ